MRMKRMLPGDNRKKNQRLQMVPPHVVPKTAVPQLQAFLKAKHAFHVPGTRKHECYHPSNLSHLFAEGHSKVKRGENPINGELWAKVVCSKTKPVRVTVNPKSVGLTFHFVLYYVKGGKETLYTGE